MLNQRRISNISAALWKIKLQVPLWVHFRSQWFLTSWNNKGVYTCPLLVFIMVSFVLPNNIYHSLEVSNYILSLPSPVFRRDRGRYYIVYSSVPVNSWLSAGVSLLTRRIVNGGCLTMGFNLWLHFLRPITQSACFSGCQEIVRKTSNTLRFSFRWRLLWLMICLL